MNELGTLYALEYRTSGYHVLLLSTYRGDIKQPTDLIQSEFCFRGQDRRPSIS